MQIDHPNAHSLTEEQAEVLEGFRLRLEQMVHELKSHPLISVQLMQEIREEVGRLLPGQRFTFDWD